MLRIDEDGYYPLSATEYVAIRHLFGVIDAFAKNDTLKDRLKLIKGGWRDYRLISVKADKLLEKLLLTIPRKKLIAMRAELQHTVCEVKLQGAAYQKDVNLALVDVDALTALADRAIQMDCLFCSKSAVEGKKCPIYRTITDCLIYEPNHKDGGKGCPLAGSASLSENGD